MSLFLQAFACLLKVNKDEFTSQFFGFSFFAENYNHRWNTWPTSYFHIPNWELKSMKGSSLWKEGINTLCSKWQSIQPTAHKHSRSRQNTWSTVESNLCDCSMCGFMNHLWLCKSISALQFTKVWILSRLLNIWRFCQDSINISSREICLFVVYTYNNSHQTTGKSLVLHGRGVGRSLVRG